MSRQVLWAPWRMTYVEGESPRTKGCIFCDLPAHGDPRENLVLHADDDAVVMLNRYPYNSGHLMVAPRRHAGDPLELAPEAWAGLMEHLRRALAALRETFRPEGVNVGANLGAAAGAGIADHLHWHLVPRWPGDTNFMPVLAEVKVVPQHLLATYDLLKRHYA
ncbi:MAG: HIT domain-containing protein [Thermodesulfobacteriota bacterium]